ncbi:MAG: AAA family ATPase [Paludibacteraceae bacterium]|nr:AAA family ATPase [Paludibacteraceae bacterium]
MITKFKADEFTAFTHLQINFSEGINILIGENGTGKTHVMKAIYSACCVSDKRLGRTFDDKLKAVFLPNTIGRLVHRKIGRASGKITIYREHDGKDGYISCTITTLGKADVIHKNWIADKKNESIFIPVKDMLANAPGFRALYSQKDISYEEVYPDIIDKAFLPIPRGKQDDKIAKLLTILQGAIDGRVIEKQEHFYLKNKNGELEFPLLAEGFRKLGLLYTLIHNGTLTKGSVLFWDEPEANLNPKLSRVLVQVLLELQRLGVQIFISTHDYILLKEFQLAATEKDKICYHALYRGEDMEIQCQTTDNFSSIFHNAIDETLASILDREISNEISAL